MGGRGASSNVYNQIETKLKQFIKKNGLPNSFTLPNMQDRKQIDTAYKAINESYKLTKEESEIYRQIRTIKEDGRERLYYQGANRDVTDLSQSAKNGVKKWMAHSYINRK